MNDLVFYNNNYYYYFTDVLIALKDVVIDGSEKVEGRRWKNSVKRNKLCNVGRANSTTKMITP